MGGTASARRWARSAAGAPGPETAVTVRLCPDHRRRLIEALGRQDADEIERPMYDWE